MFDDRDFILKGRWSGQTCCLKKRPKPGEKAGVTGYSDFGIITNNLFPIDVWRDDGSLAGNYKTIDDLLEAGWIVD